VRVIGVVDLKDGRAVHARAGRRAGYAPIERVAGVSISAGDPAAVAREYARRGVGELYVADLDAIEGRAPQDDAFAGLIGFGPVWIDAGVSTLSRARHYAAMAVSRVVVGLETLTSFERLGDICDALGADRVAFSLDLRDGRPILAGDLAGSTDAPAAIAARACDAGANVVIVLDLARVGTSLGIDVDLLARIREQTRGATLIAGGGVRGPLDLERLEACGCDAALVATALLNGTLTISERSRSPLPLIPNP
jgi:phosphoribosylformimino-5-aminoimidazole carboxamide ribotide isomerase